MTAPALGAPAPDGPPLDAVVLAGGPGTRLRSVVREVPKPLSPVAGRPLPLRHARGLRGGADPHPGLGGLRGRGPYRADGPRRKPAPGMVLDAATRHGLDVAASVLVGDRATDVAAARAAGVGAALLVPASPAEAAAVPEGTVILPSVGAAARWVLSRRPPSG